MFYGFVLLINGNLEEEECGFFSVDSFISDLLRTRMINLNLSLQGNPEENRHEKIPN